MPLSPRSLLPCVLLVSVGFLFGRGSVAQDAAKKAEPTKTVEKKDAPKKDADKAPAVAVDPAVKEADRIKSWEKQIEAFEADDAKKPFPTGETVFVGSSSIRMWKLADSFGDRKVLNRGFGGSQLVDSVTYLDKLVIKHKPKTVVLYAGDNDLAGGKSVEKVVSDFKDFVTRLHSALPQTKIIYIAIKPSIARWKLIDKVRAANQQMQSFAASSKNVVFVEVEKPMLGENHEPRPELFVKDGLHMTPEGYKIWTALVTPHLDK